MLDLDGYNPCAYGARWNGITDDTAAIQRCIDDAVLTGNNVVLPPGIFRTTGTLYIRPITNSAGVRVTPSGLWVRGFGTAQTVMRWDGDDDVPGWEFNAVNKCGLADLNITTLQTLYEGVRITGTTGFTGPSFNQLERVHILGGGRLTYGIGMRLWNLPGWTASTAYAVEDQVYNGTETYEVVTAGTSASSGGPTGQGTGITDGSVVWDWVRTGIVDDRKNDHNRFTDCMVQSYTNTGVCIEGYNSISNEFRGCLIQGRRLGLIGVDTTTVPGFGGGFIWNGGMCAENTDVDFQFGVRQSLPISVTGCFSQRSTRWIRVIGALGTVQPVEAWPIRFQGCKWGTQLANLPADGEIIQCYSPGPLVIDNCSVGANAAFGTLKFRYEPRGIERSRKRGGFTWTNNKLACANDSGWWPAERPGDLTGSFRVDNNDIEYPMSLDQNPWDGGTNQSGYFIPRRDDDWIAAGLPMPFSWQDCQEPKPVGEWAASTSYVLDDRVTNGTDNVYLCTDAGTSASSGGPSGTGSAIVDGGVVWQWLTSLGPGPTNGLLLDRKNPVRKRPWDLTPLLDPLDLGYRQTRTPWDEYLVRIPEIAGAQFTYDDDNDELAAITESLALGAYVEFPTAPAGDSHVVVLGGGATGANTGPGVVLRSNGDLRIRFNATVTDSTYNAGTGGYVDGNPHLVVLRLDRRNSVLELITDRETVTAPYAATGQSIPNKGWGSSAGAQNAAEMYIRLIFAWSGLEAERLTATMLRTSMRWP